MGLLLPLAALFYAGEAEACICLNNKTEFFVDYLKPQYKKASYYFATDPEHNKISNLETCVPQSKRLAGYVCEIKYAGEPNFVAFPCTVSLKAVNNIPVRHGDNEVRVYALATDGTLSKPLVAQWYVKMRAETPTPQNWVDDKVAALVHDDGTCNPLKIPIFAENGSTIRYRINGVEYSTGALNEPNAPAQPPYWVPYELQTQGKTVLEPGEELTLTIWATDVLPKTKCTQAKPVQSPVQTWIVVCPVQPNPSSVVIIDPRQRSGYASKAILHFHVTEGDELPLCSLNDSPAIPCTAFNPLSKIGHQEYAGPLTAGEYVFRVYAGTAMAEHRWRVNPPELRWTQSLPDNTTNTSATFSYEPLTGVDLVPVYSCFLNDVPLPNCNPPVLIENLTPGVYTFEVYATTAVGTGSRAHHVWEVKAPGDGGGGIGGDSIQPPDKAMGTLGTLEGGCTTSAAMPWSLLALASLWAVARRRKN